MSTARAILGAGEVRLAMFNPTTQAYEPFGEPVDCDKMEIKPDFEKKTATSKRHTDYGQARASVTLPKLTTLTIDITSADRAALAMQFQGLIEELSQASGSVAAESVKVTAKGVPLQLAKMNVSDQGFVLKGASGTALVPGTDYTVNWARGTVTILAASAVAEGDTLKATYAHNTIDGARILGGRNPQVRCKIAYDGVNMVDQSPLLVDIHECVLGVNSAFDFLADDFGAITLGGDIVTPPGKSQGYEITML